MVDRPVIRARVAVIQTRLRELRARLRRGVTAEQLARDMTVQAVILHNFQIVIQACCDVASHIVADQELGVPGTSAEVFEILARNKVIPWPLADRFGKHVGLRNRIVHGYNKLDYGDIHATLPKRIQDVTRFLKAIATYAKL